MTYNLNGWQYISVSGEPYKRGFEYGLCCAEQFRDVQKMLNFMIYDKYGVSWDFFIKIGKTLFEQHIKKTFIEFYEEMQGIADGITKGGTKTTLDEIIAWNNYHTLLFYWFPNQSDHILSIGKSNKHKIFHTPDSCSAFIANGSYTKDNMVVIAHNTFDPYLFGQYCNIILDLKPVNGHRMLMQTRCGCIWSGTDIFVTDAGIVGTETTIGGFSHYQNKSPISCRIRHAMQYGDSLDDYVKILLNGNSGDYANSWLFGNLKTNEIMRFELGLEYWLVDRTYDGYYVGANYASDPRIRNLECNDIGFRDVRTSVGARQVRLPQLMEHHRGKIDEEIAKEIISDHFDILTNSSNPCSRTICCHCELDGLNIGKSIHLPNEPHGAVDGAVITAKMGLKMQMCMRYGNSCGIPFDVKKFCTSNSQWKDFEQYLHNRPTQPWTIFPNK